MRIVALVMLALLTLAPVARADEADDAISTAIELYDDLEYKAAVTTLTAVLAEKDLSAATRVSGLKYLGLSQVALGDENAARDTFRRLLEIDRRFELGVDYSPAARELLREVRLDLPSEVTVKLIGRPEGGRANSPVTIRLRVDDPSSIVDGVVVHYRTGESKRFSTVQATRLSETGEYTATILGALVKRPRLQYYITARAALGALVATLGDSSNLSALDIGAAASPGSSSVLKSPLLWAGVGAVAIAGGALAYFLVLEKPEMGRIMINPSP